MKNTKSYLTTAEAKASGLPSNEEQIERHNRLMQQIRNQEAPACAYCGKAEDPVHHQGNCPMEVQP